MRICRDRRSGTGCGSTNPDTAQHCTNCGRPLNYALQLLDPGNIINGYQIVRIIGHGGFGAVYEARHTTLNPPTVALKETFNPDFITSFAGEFAVLRHLHHDNLPHYYATFIANGNGYLVMELIPGQSLQEIQAQITDGRLRESQVLGYAVQLCGVLTYLHSQSPLILHRDIKPDNIRLTPDGLIKLVDFGLLKQGTDTTANSRHGLTLAYAPIEQYGADHSGPTDPRSDIYSLGATLYHLLTGEAPLPAAQRIAASDDSLPAPQSLNPRITPHVSQAIMTAMALTRDKRFASADHFVQALFGRAPATPINEDTVRFVPSGKTMMTASQQPAADQPAMQSRPLELTTLKQARSIAYSKSPDNKLLSSSNHRHVHFKIPIVLFVGLLVVIVLIGISSVHNVFATLIELTIGLITRYWIWVVGTIAGIVVLANSGRVWRFLNKATPRGHALPKTSPTNQQATVMQSSTLTETKRILTVKTDTTILLRSQGKTYPRPSAHPSETPLDKTLSPPTSNPTVILKQPDLIDPSQGQIIIEDLILHHDYEQLWQTIAYAGQGSYLLTGYGPFGGTSLIQCAVERARKEIENERKSDSAGAFLVFHFRLTKEDGEFEIEANNFSFGYLKTYTDQDNDTNINKLKTLAISSSKSGVNSLKKLDFSLINPLKTSFLANTRQTIPLLRKQSIDYDFAQFTTDLRAFLEEKQDSSVLQQIVVNLIENDDFPSRVVITLDKIRHLETLETLAQSRLFSSKRTLVLALSSKEDFDRWENADQRLAVIGFKEWYIRCLWKRDLDDVLFSAISSRTPDFEAQWIQFRKHLEFVGRGSLGNIIEELRHPKNINRSAGGYAYPLCQDHRRTKISNRVSKVSGVSWRGQAACSRPSQDQVSRHLPPSLGWS